MDLKTEDYPSLYEAADKASVSYQRVYIVLMGLDILLMILGSLLTIYNFQDDSPKLWIYTISALALFTSLVLTFVVKNQKYEAVWYQGRALAESIKTITWRFIMCSENFEVHLSENAVEQNFIKSIEELLNEFTDLNEFLDATIVSKRIITNKMKHIRSMNVAERKTIYLEKRIGEQKRWYSSKANYNKSRKKFWFFITICSQFLAIVASVILIKFPSTNWNAVGLLTTISSAAIAWLQLKQHQSLNQAYTTATLELNIIAEKGNHIQSDHQLAKYVLDSENAISREHTLWLAQKRK